MRSVAFHGSRSSSPRLFRFRRDVRASGATGKTHDWRVSRLFVELADRPVILAGGLTPDIVKRD
jgi:phosphoribosylanthranilate isomerase